MGNFGKRSEVDLEKYALARTQGGGKAYTYGRLGLEATPDESRDLEVTRREVVVLGRAHVGCLVK